MESWKIREQQRFANGTYKPVPVWLHYPPEHYLHLSVTATESDYVAYTPSDTYGEADRQVRLKFGRYLRKTFDTLTDADIQAHVTALKSALAIAEQPATLHFATDTDTINRIFETEMRACGSEYASCMYNKFADDDIRPYHVYANSPDVAVAYVTAGGRIVSRSVVSTKDKVWVRCYSIAGGDNDADCGTLKQLLKDAGYVKGELAGNRLTKLDTDSVMLPYIDNSGAFVSDAGKYWLVVEDEDDADYQADCTDGTASEIDSHKCERCGNHRDDCECIYCECCDESYADGCNRCSMCEQCEGCTEHGGCGCDRCRDCGEIISPRSRYTIACDCDRCSECNKLEDDCECEKCETCGCLIADCDCDANDADDADDADETATPTPFISASNPSAAEDIDVLTLTPLEIKHKLNRAFVYLRDKYGRENVQAEFEIFIAAFNQIEEKVAA